VISAYIIIKSTLKKKCLLQTHEKKFVFCIDIEIDILRGTFYFDYIYFAKGIQDLFFFKIKRLFWSLAVRIRVNNIQHRCFVDFWTFQTTGNLARMPTCISNKIPGQSICCWNGSKVCK
jgi:hypothetical protein